MAQVEKLPVLLEKKMESSIQFFCVFYPFHIPKLLEKAETKHLELVVFCRWKVLKTPL